MGRGERVRRDGSGAKHHSQAELSIKHSLSGCVGGGSGALCPNNTLSYFIILTSTAASVALVTVGWSNHIHTPYYSSVCICVWNAIYVLTLHCVHTCIVECTHVCTTPTNQMQGKVHLEKPALCLLPPRKAAYCVTNQFCCVGGVPTEVGVSLYMELPLTFIAYYCCAK